MKYFLFTLIFFTTQTFAQSTPSEFAEMSLQDLFEQNIYDADPKKQKTTRWTLTLQLKAVEFEGYVDGTTALSFDDVLWTPPNEPRTTKNFPVLPTVINQQAHIFALGYKFNEKWQGHIAIPHIKQKTDHISIVSDYDFFIIESTGMGDTAISASYNWQSADKGNWRFSFGVSLPTGSIDEIGDTPRELGDQQLPYTMQLGSGTYDIPLELSYQNQGEHDFNMGVSANIRTGTNDRNYRLGNNFSINGRYNFELSNTVESFVGLGFQYSDSISGQDDSIVIDSPFPYPAGITNPKLYGGKKINLRLGVLWQVAQSYRLNLEIGKPVYQNLNGPQPKEQWRSAIFISKAI